MFDLEQKFKLTIPNRCVSIDSRRRKRQDYVTTKAFLETPRFETTIQTPLFPAAFTVKHLWLLEIEFVAVHGASLCFLLKQYKY